MEDNHVEDDDLEDDDLEDDDLVDENESLSLVTTPAGYEFRPVDGQKQAKKTIQKPQPSTGDAIPDLSDVL